MMNPSTFSLVLVVLTAAPGLSDSLVPMHPTASSLPSSVTAAESVGTRKQTRGSVASFAAARPADSSGYTRNNVVVGGYNKNHNRKRRNKNTALWLASAVRALVNGETDQQEMIPLETSLTNNPRIPDEAATLEVLWQKERKRKSISDIHPLTWGRFFVPSRRMLPELAAESFGTFLLLQLALGIVFSSVLKGSMEGVFPIAALTGMAITAACAVVGSKCAAHFNPAITFSMCLYRNFGWSKFIPYLGAQLLGAMGAAAINYGLYATTIAQYEITNNVVRSSMGGIATAKVLGCYFADPITPATAFLAEAFGTFALTSVVFALTSNNNKQARGLFIPPIIGSTVALLISILGPISCASLNPARELGPRLVLRIFGWKSAAFHQLGLYLLAPLVGAALGGIFVDKCLYAKNDDEYNIINNDPALTMKEAFSD